MKPEELEEGGSEKTEESYFVALTLKKGSTGMVINSCIYPLGVMSEEDALSEFHMMADSVEGE